MTPRLLPLGDSAWTVEFGHAIDAATNARVMGLAGRVAAARQNDPLLAPVTDVVPTFRSLTVHFDPWAGDATALGRQLLSMAQEGQQTTVQGRQWQLPVCFDDDFAPDLPRVCELKQLSRSEVITVTSSTDEACPAGSAATAAKAGANTSKTIIIQRDALIPAPIR